MDSRALYRLIEQEIAPLFYQRNDQGIPVNWLEKVRESMKQLSPAFITQRMVADYATRFYTAGSSRFLNLSKDDCSEGRSVVEWQNRVSAAWSKVAIESATDNAGQENRLKTELEITITANLDGLCPDDVAVEVVTGRVVRNRELAGTQVISASYSQQLGNGRHQYKCVLPLLEPGYRGYVCRIIPKNADIVCDAELGLRCWQASSS
jgi:starch phosphorylase